MADIEDDVECGTRTCAGTGSARRGRCLFAVRREPGGASKHGDGCDAGAARHCQLVRGALLS
jgi:hypothetical protein